MTDPLKLAEEIERMDEYGARAADRTLLAAALRLAEETEKIEELSADYLNTPNPPKPYRPWLTALAAYRKARGA